MFHGSFHELSLVPIHDKLWLNPNLLASDFSYKENVVKIKESISCSDIFS